MKQFILFLTRLSEGSAHTRAAILPSRGGRPYLISQQQRSLPHCRLHLLMGYEPIPLRRLARAAWAWCLESGEQPVHFACVVLHKFNGTGKLCPILYCHTAILLSRDDIVKLLRLEKDTGYLAKTPRQLVREVPGGTERGRTPLL